MYLIHIYLQTHNLLQTFTIFIVPRYPKCNEYGINTIVTTRTYDSLTLNTTQLANDSCIMIGPQQTNNSDGCIPATHSLISFQNLTSSKPYEVFIFSYLNVSDETTVYSPASCLLGKTYTCKLQHNVLVLMA